MGISAPGSLGGHDVLIAGDVLGSATVPFISWGGIYLMTPNFLGTYGATSNGGKLFVLFSDDLICGNAESPEGFDRPTLLDDIQAVKAA
jgi:hypothetical protein